MKRIKKLKRNVSEKTLKTIIVRRKSLQNKVDNVSQVHDEAWAEHQLYKECVTLQDHLDYQEALEILSKTNSKKTFFELWKADYYQLFFIWIFIIIL